MARAIYLWHCRPQTPFNQPQQLKIQPESQLNPLAILATTTPVPAASGLSIYQLINQGYSLKYSVPGGFGLQVAHLKAHRGPDKIEKIQVNQIKNTLTKPNLMSYDMHGTWDMLSSKIS